LDRTTSKLPFDLGIKGILTLRVDLIEQWVIVSGIVYIFLGLWFMIGHVRLTLLIMGGPHWGIDKYRLFNYLSDFAGNWVKGVYMCQNDTSEIISQSDHPFKSYDQKSKCSIYVYHWVRLIRFHMKILAASDTESDYGIHCHSTCTDENNAYTTGLQKETIKGIFKTCS